MQALAPVIESCDIDGFIAGPALGAPIDTAQLLTVLLRSQAARQKAAAEAVDTSVDTSSISPKEDLKSGAANRLIRSFSNLYVESPKATAEMPSQLDQPRSPLSRQTSGLVHGLNQTRPSSAHGRLSPGTSVVKLSSPRHSLQLGSLDNGLGNARATTPLPRSASFNTVFSNLTGTPASGAVSTASPAGANSLLDRSSMIKASTAQPDGTVTRSERVVGSVGSVTPAGGAMGAGSEVLQPVNDNIDSKNALMTLEKEAGTAAVGDGQAGPDTASGSGVRGLASLNNTELLQQLLGEIARLKKEVGEAGF